MSENVTYARPGLSTIYESMQRHDPSIAFDAIEHFVAIGTTTQMDLLYTSTQVTAGTKALSTTEPGGILTVNSGSTTAGQGLNIQKKNLTYLPATARNGIYEARLRFDADPSKAQFLAGLAVIDTSIISGGATGVNSLSDGLGFSMTTASQSANAGCLYAFCASGSVITTNSNTVAIVASTWYILTAVITGKSKVRFWIRVDDPASALYGTLYDLGEIITNIPLVMLTESLVVQTNGSSGQPIVSVDYWRTYQALK